ncbi:MAG: PHP domain-containing protein [Candidatus Lokiarchaeota archaeon]|nr:PHP domain-containing protein [Candidatus Lokiarchaeota archaeon]
MKNMEHSLPSSLRYDFHLHSDFSDGMNTIEEMIFACLDQEITHMAITDHLSETGYFNWYNQYEKDAKKLPRYLNTINKMKLKYQGKIKIYAGAEISTDFGLRTKHYSGEEDIFSLYLDRFSIFLIEGWYISNPYRSAINLRKYLDELGYSDIPISIAHPEFTHFSHKKFSKLIKMGIGIELNESKFSGIIAQDFLRIYKQLTDIEKSQLNITIGSDAHYADGAGKLQSVHKFIDETNLKKNVILPKEIQ